MSSSAGCAAASPSLRRAHAPPIKGRGARSGSILSPSTRRRRAVVVAAKDGDNGWMKGLEGIGGILKRMPGVTIYQVRPRVLPHTRPHPRHAHPATRRTPSRNKDPTAPPPLTTHPPHPSHSIHKPTHAGRRASARVTRRQGRLPRGHAPVARGQLDIRGPGTKRRARRHRVRSDVLPGGQGGAR